MYYIEKRSIWRFARDIVKAIYWYIPFKQKIFFALRSVWTPNGAIFKYFRFRGVFTVPIDQTRKFVLNHYGLDIENEIFWQGLKNGWEKESMKLWIKLCEEADVVIDIGANTGLYSMVAKAMNPNAKVYSFEPQSMFFKMLCKNIESNSFDIIPIEKALSSHDGKVTIDDFSGQLPSLTVDCLTMDTFINQNGLKKIDLIKIDIETHEPQVLAGFSNYLSKFRPTMLIEILNNDVAKKVHEMVHELGYLYFNIDERGGIRQTDKIEKSDYLNYLLCSREVAVKIGQLKV